MPTYQSQPAPDRNAIVTNTTNARMIIYLFYCGDQKIAKSQRSGHEPPVAILSPDRQLTGAVVHPLFRRRLVSERLNPPRCGGRVGPGNDLFEACSAFTHIRACTLVLSPYVVTPFTGGFNHFVASTLLRLLPAGAIAGWGAHPQESAALSRRTPGAVIREVQSLVWTPKPWKSHYRHGHRTPPRTLRMRTSSGASGRPSKRLDD